MTQFIKRIKDDTGKTRYKDVKYQIKKSKSPSKSFD